MSEMRWLTDTRMAILTDADDPEPPLSYPWLDEAALLDRAPRDKNVTTVPDLIARFDEHVFPAELDDEIDVRDSSTPRSCGPNLDEPARRVTFGGGYLVVDPRLVAAVERYTTPDTWVVRWSPLPKWRERESERQAAVLVALAGGAVVGLVMPISHPGSTFERVAPVGWPADREALYRAAQAHMRECLGCPLRADDATVTCPKFGAPS